MAPRLKEKYIKEVVPALKEQLALANVNEVPRLEKIVVNMGVGAAVAGRQAARRGDRGPAHHHRPAADDHARQEVDRRLQDPPGHADRREGHPSRRPHVGVLGPPALDRDPACPRLPRPEPQLVRRSRQLLDGRRPSSSSSPRSTTTRSTARAAWTSRSSRLRRQTRAPRRCSTPSASRSSDRASIRRPIEVAVTRRMKWLRSR